VKEILCACWCKHTTTTKCELAHFYYSVSAPPLDHAHDEECARSLLPRQCTTPGRHQAPNKTLLLHSSKWFRQRKQRARLLASSLHAPHPGLPCIAQPAHTMLPSQTITGRGICVYQGIILCIRRHAFMTGSADTNGSGPLQDLNRVSNVTRVGLAS
jgi:hypothetical protein